MLRVLGWHHFGWRVKAHLPDIVVQMGSQSRGEVTFRAVDPLLMSSWARTAFGLAATARIDAITMQPLRIIAFSSQFKC